MQDFTGVPGVVDLAAMRDALARLGGNASRVNPLVPVELVIDHSVIIERSGDDASPTTATSRIEYQRNLERYQLLRWAQGAFDGFRVVPPGTGICHQVNLEYLSRLVFATEDGRAFCDTLVGTDSHTVDGERPGRARLGCRRDRGRGRHARPAAVDAPPAGGRAAHQRRAQAGHHRHRRRADGHRAAPRPRRRRRVRRVLRAGRRRPAARDPGHHRQHEPRVRRHLHDVPDRPGDTRLPALHRARRGPPGPGRGLRQGAGALARPRPRPSRSTPSTSASDLGDVEPSLAGPGAPQDRVPLGLGQGVVPGRPRRARPARRRPSRRPRPTTGCATATSSSRPSPAAPTPPTPRSSSAAGLLAQKAVERGLRSKPWVKTSLAPGSRVVMDYLERAGLIEPLDAARLLSGRLRLHHLHRQLGAAARRRERGRAGEADLSVAAVLSGNRNFEGRIHPDVRLNYLGLAPAGGGLRAGGHHGPRPDHGADRPGQPRATRSCCPTSGPRIDEVSETIRASLTSEMFRTPLLVGLRRRRVLAARCRSPGGRDLRLAGQLHVREEPAVLRGRWR